MPLSIQHSCRRRRRRRHHKMVYKLNSTELTNANQTDTRYTTT